MRTYFARQPILDRHQQLYAYELLYRGGPHADNSGVPLEEDKATAAVMEALLTQGIEKITGGKKAFVNFSQKMLVEGMASFFPPKGIVVEILENIEPTPAVLDELRRLKSMGYTLALDDFTYKPSLKPFLTMADIIKIDFLDNVFKMKNFYAICSHINLSKCILLAEKIENQKVYEKAAELGCQLFQGYYFARPDNVSERTVSVMRINTLRLLSEVSKREIDFDCVTEIIKQDVGLAYKVLKLVNSAYFSLTKEIEDLKKAIIYLGHRELKKWVGFVALTNMNTNKPSELTEMCMVRARFCEMLAYKMNCAEDSEAFFLTGLFSLLDIILDTTLPSVIKDLMLPDLARAALLGEGGGNTAREALDMIAALERGAWSDVLALCDRLGVASGDMSDSYLEALRWSSDLHNTSE